MNKALAGVCTARVNGKEYIFCFYEGGQVTKFDPENNYHVSCTNLPYAITAPKMMGQVHGSVKLASLLASLGIIK